MLSGLGLTDTAPLGGGAVRERWESLAALRGLAGELAQADPGATLADALPGWLGDRERLATLGQRARQLAVDRYDWERVVDGLEAICAEVAA